MNRPGRKFMRQETVMETLLDSAGAYRKKRYGQTEKQHRQKGEINMLKEK